MQKYFPVLLLLILLLIAWRWQWGGGKTVIPEDTRSTANTSTSEVLDRNARLEYTAHARCRMECRHVTEAEVQDILNRGKVNTTKSNARDYPCPTYALEGYSRDGQHLRIVFAPCEDATRVITCIDLDKEWQCHCD